MKIKPDTIFVSVASYRDKLCSKTIESIFSSAEFPERIFVGICQQNELSDSDCINFDSKIIKPYVNNIRIIRLPHFEAKGPCVARYWCSTLWNGEEYFLQADSHVLMSENWDSKAINMIKEIKLKNYSQKPILSHYTRNYEDRDEPNPKNEVPRMCKAFFNERGMISFLGATNISIDKHTYVETPYIAGGFLFAEHTFLKDVPFDPNLPFLFVGEEILLSIRAWTSGYDIYTPSENLMFHLYTRKDDNKIWTDKVYKDDDALNKVKLLIKLVPDGDVSEYLKENLDKYGLGSDRTIEEYYDFAGIDINNKTVSKDFCKDSSVDVVEHFGNISNEKFDYIYFICICVFLYFLFLLYK